MKPWTREDLARLFPAPRARSETDERVATHAAYLATLLDSWETLQKAGVNTPLRVAHFLTIAGHETGGLTIVREACTWKYERMCELWPNRFKAVDPIARGRYLACRGDDEALAELAYNANTLAKSLGNSEPGDGWAYRGGAWFQLTGRAAYREVGQAIGHDLEGAPQDIEDPRIALRAALWYWQRYKLGEMADRNYLLAIHRQINCGNPYTSRDPNGWPDRQRWFDRAWAIFGKGLTLPSPLDIGIGASGPEVASVQNRLRELGYPCGKADGVWGPECRRAIAAFKADWTAGTGLALEPGETVGPATREALAVAQPIRRPEREAMTVGQLRAAGSSEVAAGLNMQRLALPTLGLGLAGGATQPAAGPTAVDPTPALQGAIGWIPGAKAMLVPAIDAVQWSLHNWWWVAAIGMSVWLYAGGWMVVRARLDAARRGLNLWR